MMNIKCKTEKEYADFLRSTTLYVTGEVYGGNSEILGELFKALQDAEDADIIRELGQPGDLEEFVNKACNI